MASQEEVERLYAQAVVFVEQHLRSPANPTVQARPLVHSKAGHTHLIVPLSAANEIVFTAGLLTLMQRTFPPDGAIRTRPVPDGSQIQYELLIPLTGAGAGASGAARGRSQSKSRPNAAGGGILDNPVVLMLVLAIALACGYLFVVAPILAK